MKKYYTLLLNNTYDIGTHVISKYKPCTMFPNILEQETNSLDKIDTYFTNLDDIIIPTDEGYKIYGSFPVIGTIVDGKMYDVITNKEIKFAKDKKGVYGLSYSSQEEIPDSTFAEYLLSRLNEESIKRYTDNINRVENYCKNIINKDKYSLLKPQEAHMDSYPLIIKEINGELIDVVSKERVLILPYNAITSHIHRHYKQDISQKDAKEYCLTILEHSISEYIKELNESKSLAKERYNEFKQINTIKKVKTR